VRFADADYSHQILSLPGPVAGRSARFVRDDNCLEILRAGADFS
jgi:hypothetical protein